MRMTHPGFRARLERVHGKLLEAVTAATQADGTVSAADRIDLQVVRFFAEYIEWELDHRDAMEYALIVPETMKHESHSAPESTTVDPAACARRYESCVDLELSGCIELLRRVAARHRLQARDRDGSRRDTTHDPCESPRTHPNIRWDQTVFQDGFFRYQDRPVFTAGFNMLTQPMVDEDRYPELAAREAEDIVRVTEEMRQLGVGVLGGRLPVPGLIRRDRSVNLEPVRQIAETFRQYAERGFRVNVLLNWNADPVTLESIWPGITGHGGNSLPLDIDHPGTRMLVRHVMAEAMPILRERTEILAWDLANEPFFSPDDWSEHTLAKYRAWLAGRYASVDRLNSTWKTAFETFDAIPLPGARPRDAISAGEWFDRVRFHNLRVAEFFTFVADEIRTYIPDAAIHVKGQDNSSLGPRPAAVTDGIDRELLTPACRLQGVDTRPLPVTEPRMSAGGEVRDPVEVMNYDEAHYGFHWLGQSFLYDYLTSLEPSLPIVDFEYHAFSINAIRIPDIPASHPRATLWLAHLHGLIANNVWYWHRRYGPDPFPADYFRMWLYGSISTQPLFAAGYFHTMLELNTFAAEVAALATVADRPVRLLVSMPSYIQNQSHIDALHRVYEGTCFHGLRAGCVTEQMLAAAGAPDGCRLIVVPDVEYMSGPALDGLRRLHEDGMKIVLFGSGRPVREEHGIRHSEADTSFLDSLPRLEHASAPDLDRRFAEILAPFTSLLPLRVRVAGTDSAFGIVHRAARVNGDRVVLLVNVKAAAAVVEIRSGDGTVASGVDLLTGETVDGSAIEMPYQGVRLIRLAASP